jgi:hypothetical protein
MKIEVTDDELALIVESLEHRYSYSRAAKRDDARFQEWADRLKAGATVPKKKR